MTFYYGYRENKPVLKPPRFAYFGSKHKKFQTTLFSEADEGDKLANSFQNAYVPLYKFYIWN